MTLPASINSPVFLKIITSPLILINNKYHSKILCAFLNKLLWENINDGELDFLENRKLCISVQDVNINYNLSLKHKKIIAHVNTIKHDLFLQANTYDFLSLAARQEDPDTLVFQRRMTIEGDTELGLELKNFIDGLDIESNKYFPVIQSLLIKILPIYKRIAS